MIRTRAVSVGGISRRGAGLCCELSFKNRRRRVFASGYTELFFLDEATALAAGHRPCFECRHAEAVLFRDAFALGNRLAATPRADEMDLRLHAERRSPPIPIEDWRELPEAAMVALGREACLVLGGGLLGWSPGGYRHLDRGKRHVPLRLLTPPAMVAALRAGYRARLHPSALKLRGDAVHIKTWMRRA